MNDGPIARVETFVGKGEHPYFFLLVASNGEVVATSEGYLRRSDRDQMARELARALGAEMRARSST